MARVSGDTLAVVHPDGSPEGAAAYAQCLLRDLPAAVDATDSARVDHALPVHVHIGVVLWPGVASGATELLAAGEEALNLARESGANQYRFYSAQAHVVRGASTSRSRRRSATRSSGVARASSVAYQPQFDVAGGAARGAEALLRFTHPTLGPVPPERIVAVAEATGLIDALGLHVLRAACRDGAALRAVGPGLRIAVNVAAHQLTDPGFPRA